MNGNRPQNRIVMLPDGTSLPKLGQGTWHMAESAAKRQDEIRSLRRGIELGMTLIDTAEMYADGGAEKLVGEAIRGFDRDSLFLVSKVYPHNAGRTNIFKSCENSLKRMNADFIDLYLLHWRGMVPLQETVDCMQELIRQGKIRRFGVSNFDTEDMEELMQTPGGEKCAANQVLYHLGSRGIEYDLLPFMAEHRIPCMAYCPVAQGGRLNRSLLNHPSVTAVSHALRISPVQVLLGFVLQQKDMIAIPKAGTPGHVEENAVTMDIRLEAKHMEELNAAFPVPTRKQHLDIQ